MFPLSSFPCWNPGRGRVRPAHPWSQHLEQRLSEEGARILVVPPVMRTRQVSGGQLGPSLERVREKLRKRVAGRNDIGDAAPAFGRCTCLAARGPGPFLPELLCKGMRMGETDAWCI